MQMSYIRPILLDASAALKLVCPEPGSVAILRAFSGETSLHITDVCLIEALGVLKRKWITDGNLKAYHERSLQLTALTKTKIRVLRTDITESETFAECERLSVKHKIDLIDALQLVSFQRALAVFTGESTPKLLSADRDLYRAARAEGFVAELCSKD
jgi:predicted nucleic acid-binding protein